MWVKCLGFALLLWIPAELHAQRPLPACSAPTLGKGYFLPVEDSYPPKTQITYSCDNGYKPAVEGWWATSTCVNAKWSPDPQCIEEAACLPPKIPNAKYPEPTKGWYKDGKKIAITCNSGYVHAVMENNTAVCTRGTWSIPVCQRSPASCSEPPYIPNMVIIHQKQQETFANRSEVVYQCKDGYITTEGTTAKSTCVNGNWTKPPTCFDGCGTPPEVPNSVRENGRKSVTFTCVSYYTLVGPETVVCHSDGSWSEVPTCKDDFCQINTAEHPELINVGNKFLKSGEKLELECTNVWTFTNYVVVQCNNRHLQKTRCCNRAQISSGGC